MSSSSTGVNTRADIDVAKWTVEETVQWAEETYGSEVAKSFRRK